MAEVILFLIPPFVVCCSMLALLGYLGIHVLEREIIFIDIALAQIAAVGATFAHLYLGSEENSIIAYICAFVFTAIASVFFAQINRRITQISNEAIIGVSYAIAAAAALFILALAAGGDVHVEQMITGSILWAQWSDILPFIVIFAFVGLLHFLFREKFKRLSIEFRDFKKQNRNAIIWDFLFYMSMGLIITASVRIAGVLIIFSFLIIPATFSALFSNSWKNRLIIAWVMGLISIMTGLSFSYIFDFSCGPSVVSFLGLFLIIGALLKNTLKTPV
jgi:zinc/manganese transport system permease protein